MESSNRQTGKNLDQPDRSDGRLDFKVPVELDLLRIPLSVVLGEVVVTAPQLFQLSRGQLFQFGFDPDLPLRLVLAGETVAYGQVLSSADRIAIRIVSTAGGGELEKNGEPIPPSARQYQGAAVETGITDG